jgi:two-component system, chemotaxis family, CheB/CheR fusion protein
VRTTVTNIDHLTPVIQLSAMFSPRPYTEGGSKAAPIACLRRSNVSDNNRPPKNSNGHAHPNPDLVTESDYSPPRGNPFPVVGIGASAGGLEAFLELLASVPENTGLAFVLVQHLDPQHESLLAEILTPVTKLPVMTVHDGIEIQPDHVYVIPPNTSMELQDGSLRLARREPGLHLPIDIFFRSLAQVQGSRAIGVVLSGNASDGSLGVRAIKAECGITFAQDEATARFGGMPRNAVATGAIDYVLTPAEIGRELGRLSQHRFLVTPTPGVARSETLPNDDGGLKRILAMLQAATKVDFSQYKLTTIQRRIGRRLIILRLETLAEYARYLQHKPEELAELYKDMLISVTSFFRDPETFEALVRHLRPLAEERAARGHEPLRLWVPGCATGEEVYSLAICLHEFIFQQQLSLGLQIFGTDISDPALERARQAIYGAVIEDDISEQRLRRFFTKMDGGYQINKMIREFCVFARHDVTRDPPFSKLDLVSCRNVLIYLDLKAQRKVLPTFHYALNPTGLLMLGSAETAGGAADLFDVVDKGHHIYGRKAVPTRLVLDVTPGTHHTEASFVARAEVPSGPDLLRQLDRIIQARYSPDGVVVNSELQILQFKGHTSPYLDPSPGEANFNLLRMVKESLVVPLRRAVQRASEGDWLVRDEGATIEIEGRQEEVSIEVSPIVTGDGPEKYFLIVFNRGIRGNPSRAIEGAVLPPDIEHDTQLLHRELAETREFLRSVREEYEANAEELRAANEEARSANEELQSTNEELGTTKEELQSANEELTTVNEELQNRNRELAAINSDLRNVLSSVTLAILMVDDDLRVRRFNTAAEKLLGLGPIDVGRPIGHLRGRFETPILEEQVRRVIDTLNATTEEVQDANRGWYSIGVRPYRTVDERIAGAVITFQDIDVLKRGRDAAEQGREYAESLIETVREPLVVLDADLRVQRATVAFYQTFLVSREEVEGRFLYDLGNGQWNRQRLRELLGSALFKSEPFQDFEVEHDFPHIGRRKMRLNARRIPLRDSQQRTLLLAMEDVTERQEIAEIRFRRLFESAKDGIIVVDSETEIVEDVNAFFLQLTGFPREDFTGRTIADMGNLLQVPKLAEIVPETRVSEIVRHDDLPITTRDGAKKHVEIVANRYMVGSQPVVQLNVRDITARKQADQALKESEERFRLVVESVRDYAIFQIDSNGKIATWNTGAEHLLGWSESEILGRSASLVFTPEDVERGEMERELKTALMEGSARDERCHRRKDGSRFFASGVLARADSATSEGVRFTKVMQDITTRKEQEDRLRQSLEEKSMLVREIHHRVKNNLQMIVSLLSLQASQTEDRHLIAAFEETEGRVRAIAHIHEQLYASDDLTTVEVGGYVSALARELVAIHSATSKRIRLKIDTEELLMHIEKAIPVGLIANELIINSLKHGMRDGTGDLKVALRSVARDDGPPMAELCVEDNGPGLPAGFDLPGAQSMGYQLVYLLVRQLRARLEIGPGPGAGITVSFAVPRH